MPSPKKPATAAPKTSTKTKPEASRLRMSFDADSEEVRRAIYIAAATKGITHNQLLSGLVREVLHEYVAIAARAVAEEESAKRGGDKGGMA